MVPIWCQSFVPKVFFENVYVAVYVNFKSVVCLVDNLSCKPFGCQFVGEGGGVIVGSKNTVGKLGSRTDLVHAHRRGL